MTQEKVTQSTGTDECQKLVLSDSLGRLLSVFRDRSSLVFILGVAYLSILSEFGSATKLEQAYLQL